MFRFEDPIYLYLLALLPLLVIIRYVGVALCRRRLKKNGDAELLSRLMPDVSRWRPAIKFWLLIAVWALLTVILARPQFGTRISHEKRKGIETIICMDISNSMLAQDVKPSRLVRCKMIVENMIDHFTDDKIGVIVFAGDAFVQLPITSDYVSAKMFLDNIDPGLIQMQGTDIGKAITIARHSFTQEKNIGKAIIVITDGEDHEGGATEAAAAARKDDMRVYVLGVGDAGGAPIPTAGGGYMNDRSGNTVMSALNETMCREIAKAGGGAYIHVTNNSTAQDQLDNELDKLSKKETNGTIYSAYDEQFQAVALIALLLLILEPLILERKSPLTRNISLFSRKKALTAILFLLLPVMATAQNDRQYIRQGNRLFRTGKYAEAEVSYRKALEKNPRNAQAVYNLGNALMAQQKDSDAVEMYQQSGKLESNTLRRSKSYHNMGTLLQGHKMFGEAIEAYKESLRLNPSDDETRYNLELCRRQLKNQGQDNQQQQKKDNKDQQQNKDKQKQQQEQQNKDKQKQQQEQQKQQKPKMSKENAEQLLNAAMQEEKQTQKKMKQQRQDSRQLEKNW